MDKKKVLVTGGAGFIGSHLCKKLIDLGCSVVCIDNLFTGNLINIKKILNSDHFEFIEHDIVKPIFLTGIDEIYNLACPASPIHYQLNPIKTLKTCTTGVINMLGLARANKAKILQASTSEVYGDPLEHPQNENYYGNVNTTGLRSCYDEGKRCSETLFSDYKRQHKLNIRIVRIFNTYGPNMAVNDGRVISNFIVQAISNKNISINGDGSQTRSFMFVDDLVEALIKVMNCNDFQDPINIGNPNEISINDLAYKILELTKSTSKIEFNNLPEDDPKRRMPNIERISDLIDWQPTISLEDGLMRTINYFNKN